MPHNRTKSRELALQYLYMHDLMKGKQRQLLSDYLGSCTPKPDNDTSTYTRKLVESVLEHSEELDQYIAEVATNWKVMRMPIVDRNILRLGLAELINFPETPFKVSIDEGIELARRFSSEEACSFVNGILDKLYAKHCSDEEQPSEDKSSSASTESHERTNQQSPSPTSPKEPCQK